MKTTVVIIALAILGVLNSCKTEQPLAAPNKTAAIDTIQDLQRLDSVLWGEFLYRREVIIQTDSAYQMLHQEAVARHGILPGRSFASVDFSTRTVVGIGDRGIDLADTTGGITQHQFICIRNDSTRKYTCISRFIYPDIRPRYMGDFIYVTYLYSIPKLLPGYNVVFVRDSI